MTDREPENPKGKRVDPDTEQVLNDLADGYLDRLQSGESPDRESVVSAHPDLGSLLDRRLALVELMFQSRPPEKRPDVPSTRRPAEKEESGTVEERQPSRREETVDVGGPEERPKSIGPYKVLDVLGKGGMGIVYLADQTEPVQRRVALKLIKVGMDTRDVIARFESERQALALMNHPSIAHVYEAGATEEGRPFFAMEHVPGSPVTDYCDRNRVTTRERLLLFVQICDAVQHAHQKGIIHRDLKPSNILVTVPNGRPVPKIIDFGVAKATSRRLTEETVYTEHGRIIGTPEYMSPEQAELTCIDVDTRTDIYSLGVVLYELLVGTLPYASKDLRGGGLSEIRRRIREEEPPKPSTRVSTLGEVSTEIAKRRRTNPSSLSRLLKGDLDWITMKAMEKDRTRRYATASELAADVGRFLKDEPVLAGPPSAIYLLKKFVQAHRWHVMTAMALWIGLLGGFIIAFIWITSQYLSELEITRLQRQQQESSASALDRAYTDKASREVESMPPEDPEIEAEMRDTIGRSYRRLGYYEKAEPHLRKAFQIRRRLLGPEDIKTLDSMNRLALLLGDRGEYGEAERLLREALETEQRVLGADDPRTLGTMGNLAEALMDLGNLKDAEGLALQALDSRRRVLGANHVDTISSMHTLGALRKLQGDLVGAEVLYRDTLKRRRRVLGDAHKDTLETKNDLASLLISLGWYAEAEFLLRDLHGVLRRAFGDEHPHTLVVLNNLADSLHRQGEHVEAERLFRQVLEARRSRLGPHHPWTLNAMNNVAVALGELGRTEEAERLLRSALEEWRRVRGESHWDTVGAMNNLGRYLRDLGRLDESEKLLKKAVEIAAEMVRERELDTAKLMIVQVTYGGCLTRMDRFDEAEPLLLQSFASFTRDPDYGEAHPVTVGTAQKLIDLYESWGKPEKAEEYRAMIPSSGSDSRK